MTINKTQLALVITTIILITLSIYIVVDKISTSTSINEPTQLSFENSDIVFGDETIVSNGIQINDDILTISEAGEYVVTGKTLNGGIIVDAEKEDEITIVLNGVNITNPIGSAIFIKKSGDVDIKIEEGTVNSLSDGKDYSSFYTKEDVTATLFSTADLKIKGGNNSVLHIISSYKNGVVSKDDLKIDNVVIDVQSVNDGMRGKDSVEIKNSIVTIDSSGDALKSDNTNDGEKGTLVIEESLINITAGDDAIVSTRKIDIQSGEINILNSYEGIESEKINIYDGIINIVSIDDALNISDAEGSGGTEKVVAEGELNIFGGRITISSEGDGFDSNGNAQMTNGKLIIQGPSDQRNDPMDVNGNFLISGGEIVALGYSTKKQISNELSTQASLQFNFEDTQEANTFVVLKDESLNTLMEINSEKIFRSATFVSPIFVEGKSYTVYLDDVEYSTLLVSDIVNVSGEVSQQRGR